MTVLDTNISVGGDIHSGLFGGNFLFHRDIPGEDGTFTETADALGVTGLRYPGGAITEVLFDIENPDATSAYYPGSGAEESICPLSKFMQFAEETDRPVTIVLPTRHYLTEEEDELGHSYADVDEAALRQFVQDTVSGYYGSPEIKAFEIGNEYWGIGDWEDGSMSTLEYARVASEMTRIINDELSTFPQDSGAQDIDIVVQIGTNYREANLRGDYDEFDDPDDVLAAINFDYGTELDDSFIMTTGAVDWSEIANAIMINHFQDEGTLEMVDGVAAHIYTRGPELPGSRYHALDTIAETWGSLDQPVEIYITEWNQKTNSEAFDPEEGFGLRTPMEMINILEAMADAEVESADVWAIQQNTRTSLASHEGDTELNVPGIFFGMMSENLQGLSVIDLDPLTRETELQDNGFEVHMFGGEDRFVMYFMSNDELGADVNFNFHQVTGDWETATVTRLGVVEGDAPGDPDARPALTTLDEEEALENSIFMEDLEPFEIIQVVLENPTYTPQMQSYLGISEDPLDKIDPELLLDDDDDDDAAADPADEIVQDREVQFEDLFTDTGGLEHEVPADDDEGDKMYDDEDDSDAGLLGDLLGILVGFLPLLALAGL